MRVKTFTAASLQDAMEQVRKALGGDAVILSTRSVPDSSTVEVVAGLDLGADDPQFGRLPLPPEARAQLVESALLSHGTPGSLADRLGQLAKGMEVSEPIRALAGSLEIDLSFEGLDPVQEEARLMFVGPPGSGKSMALVKLATQAVIGQRPVRILTTDLKRAGAVEQLSAFAKILGQDVLIAEDDEELAEHISRIPARTAVFIDAPATNPFEERDMDQLADLAAAVPIEPVLVLNAGLDALEAGETAISYAAAGVKRLIISRLDATRRLGNVLAAMDAGPFTLAGASRSPDPAQPISPVTAGDLAEALFDEAPLLLTDLPPRKKPVVPEADSAPLAAQLLAVLDDEETAAAG